MTHRQVPTIQNEEKIVKVAQAQYAVKTVDVSVVAQCKNAQLDHTGG